MSAQAQADRQLAKQRTRFDDAAAAMAAAVGEAGMRAAVHVIQAESGEASEQAVRAAVRAQAITRRVLDTSGHLFAGVLRSALPDPWAPEAFDAAAFHVAKLLATPWRAGGGR